MNVGILTVRQLGIFKEVRIDVGSALTRTPRGVSGLLVICGIVAAVVPHTFPSIRVSIYQGIIENIAVLIPTLRIPHISLQVPTWIGTHKPAHRTSVVTSPEVVEP